MMLDNNNVAKKNISVYVSELVLTSSLINTSILGLNPTRVPVTNLVNTSHVITIDTDAFVG